MNKIYKILIYITVTVISLLMYIMTYLLVPFSLENESLKYIIMVIGYVGVIIFPFGFHNLIKEIRRNKSEIK